MLEIRSINKTYRSKGAPETRALIDVSVKFERTGMVFILGKSGSGKSTFLNVVGGLDKYDSGEIIIKGKSSTSFSGSDFDSYRNTYLGFIFQDYNIIEEFTLADNIGLALQLQHRRATHEDIERILQEVDLAGYGDRRPNQISGGQKQRVAIARALIKDPEIIFADEPTGALDSNTGAAIFETLRKLARTKLVIVVSHDREFAEIYGDRIIEFKDGRIMSDQIKTESGFEEQVKIVDGATVLEDAIRIPQGTRLTQAHLTSIQKMLTNASGDIIISCDGHINKTLADNFDPAKKRKKFVDTDEKRLNLSDSGNPYRLIKSKLPLKQASKMARSSMGHKRGRLVFSIFLAVFAIAFFGFSNVVGSFKEGTTVANAMKDFGYNHVVISKAVQGSGGIFGGGGGSSVGFSEQELNKIDSISSGAYADFYSTSAQLPLAQDSSTQVNADYFSKNVYGFVASDNLPQLGLDVPAVYGRYPQSENEILISNYIAEHFLAYGLKYYEKEVEYTFTPTKINEVINYTLRLNGYDFLIVGIINFNIERYAEFKNVSTYTTVSKIIKDEFAQRVSTEIGYVYGLPSIVNVMSDGNSNYHSYLDAVINYNIDGFDNLPMSYLMQNITFAYPQIQMYNQPLFVSVDGTSGKMPTLQKGQVVLNLAVFKWLSENMDTDIYKSFDSEIPALTTQEMTAYAQSLNLTDASFRLDAHVFPRNLYTYNKIAYHAGTIEGLEIVGFISTSGSLYSSDAALVIYNNEDYTALTEMLSEQSLFVYLEGNSQISDFAANFFGNFDMDDIDATIRYSYQLPFADTISMFSSMFGIMRIVFFYISIGFCVFAALLLLNFISTSVIYKRKEIGILRAIGARKADVTSIFLMEGFYIGLIISIIGIILVFVAVLAFNNLIASLLGLPITLLAISVLHLVYMLLVCFATVAVASILPVRKVASMRPIDAIRGK